MTTESEEWKAKENEGRRTKDNKKAQRKLS
jgi:hypothetical protein